MGAGDSGFNPRGIQRWACRGHCQGRGLWADPLRVPHFPKCHSTGWVSLPSPSGVGLYWVHLQKSVSSTLGPGDTSWRAFRWPMRVQSLGA